VEGRSVGGRRDSRRVGFWGCICIWEGSIFDSRSSLVMSSFLLKVPSGFLSPMHDLFLWWHIIFSLLAANTYMGDDLYCN